jgi:4-oxalocrotonate tautomerase
MPEIHIYLAEGRAPEKKVALMRDITQSVVKNFGVDPEAVIVQIIESKKVDKMKGGLLFTERTPAPSKP